MNTQLLQTHIPSLAAGLVVGGIVLASGGSGLQMVVSAIATGASGYATSTLVIQSQVGRQRTIEHERDRLQREIERIRQTMPLVADLEHLQRQQVLLQQDIHNLEQHRNGLEIRVRQIQLDPPNLEQLEQRQQRLGELQRLIDESSGQLRAVTDQITAREQQRDRLQEVTAQFLQRQAEVEELRERVQNLNQQAVELELLRATYDALREDEQNLAAKKQQLEADIPRIKDERDRILEEIAKMEDRARQVDALRVEIENLEAELRIKRSEVISLMRQIEQLTSEKSGLEAQVARKKIELQNLQEEIQEAKGELEEIKNTLQQAFKSLEQPIELKAKQARTFASEAEFLAAFRQYLNSKGLVFPNRVVNAFHTSLKVQDISALVILAGISGTGKSELPQAYAEFIGAPLVMLPVQPRWDSPQDLQGFYNYIEKKYKPTDLMWYLYQHEKQQDLKGRMVLVLLDEMNLAKVEYYFSDFLSKLETRRNKPTYLNLDAGSLPLTEDQKQVLLPKEFLFIGTMNEDETTQSLSDKVLDRANVLTFGCPPELKLRGSQQKPPAPEEYLPWNTFQSWTKDPQPNLTERVKDYVDQANDIMESLGRPFAHRVFQAFTKYVCNYPNADRDEAVLKQALADQFGQKLLPKLRGIMVEEEREVLDKMQNLLSTLGDDALNKAFEKARKGQYGQFQWKGMIYRED